MLISAKGLLASAASGVLVLVAIWETISLRSGRERQAA